MAEDPRSLFGVDDAPWHTRPDWAEHPAQRVAPAEYAALASAYRDDGYVVLKGIVPRELTAAVRAELHPVWHGSRFRKREYGGRLSDACWGAPSVRRLACLPEILDVLQFLYDRRPIPFQTLNFRWGTQQRAHSDVIHFSSLPPSFMCGVWVALEDVGGDQGPLFYHPGSQRLPQLSPAELGRTVDTFSYTDYEDHMALVVKEAGIEPVRFHADEGDALIWSTNLVHGGSLVDRGGTSRHSQVTHYFFEGTVGYHPIRSDMAAGELYIRDPLIDITTGRRVRPSLSGQEVRFQHLRNRRTLLQIGANAAHRPSLGERAVSSAISLVKHADARAKLVLPRLLRRPIRR